MMLCFIQFQKLQTHKFIKDYFIYSEYYFCQFIRVILFFHSLFSFQLRVRAVLLFEYVVLLESMGKQGLYSIRDHLLSSES